MSGVTAAVDKGLSWQPWDGGKDPEIWSFANNGSVSIIESPILTDGYDYKAIWLLNADVWYRSHYLSFWWAADLAWSSIYYFEVSGGTNGQVGRCTFYNPAKVSKQKHYEIGRVRTPLTATGIGSIPSLLTNVHTNILAQSATKFRFTIDAGTYLDPNNSGTFVKLYRRKSLV